MIHRALALLITAALSGCTLIDTSTPVEESFMLDAESTYRSPAPPRAMSLLVHTPSSSVLLDSHQILYSEEQYTRRAYRLATWVEPPPRRLGVLITRAIEQAGVVNEVTTQALLTRPEAALMTEVDEFYLNVQGEDANVVIRVRATLFDLMEKRQVARKEIFVSEPVPEVTPHEAVKAWSTATERLLTELVAWLDQILERAEGARERAIGAAPAR